MKKGGIGTLVPRQTWFLTVPAKAALMMIVLLELAHIHLIHLAVLKSKCNPVFFFLVQRKHRFPHQAAGEDAALYECFFQAGMSFAGRLSPAVDSLGDMIDAVGPVLGFFQGVLVRVGKYLSLIHI